MANQLLHMVLGGELKDLNVNEFADLDQVEIIGLYPNYETAKKAWKAKAQGTVDNAMTRFFIVHVHRQLNPGLCMLGVESYEQHAERPTSNRACHRKTGVPETR